VTGNIYQLRRHRFPTDTKQCLERLLAHVHDPLRPVSGIAFVAYVGDSGFIADACGRAREEPRETLRMLLTLRGKLEKWHRP
jgi:hypothetical protein